MGFVDYPDAFNHNAWPSKDGSYVFTTDEVPGQKVTILVVRDFRAGEYMVQWNGRDDGGKNVDSGIYLYRIEIPGLRRRRG